MTARHLVIGLDGADLDVVEPILDQLPHLADLMRRGAHARLRSVQPPATLPNWTTFLTGVDPGVHGVFDFTTRTGYRVAFTAGTVREAPTVVLRLDRLGLACACVGFPATWPPEPLSNGVFISGWDAPVAFEADRSFVWPAALYDEIRRRFGTPTFDDVDELRADEPGWHRRLPEALEQRIERKTRFSRWLLDGRSWDLFAFYFGESDTAAHHLFSLHDPTSPRRPPGVTRREADGLARVYRALDAAVGELVGAAGPDVEVTLLSDHGSGASSDRVLYLNRALADAGLLRFRRRGVVGSAVSIAKEVALTRLSPRLRERLFRAGGARLPSALESRARFGGIDMARTVAFSEELNYFPSVCLNVAGREPRGVVPASRVAEVTRDVERALRALRDPWSGERVVADVHRREDLYAGPHVDRAPDLLLELRLVDGHSYNLMPSAGAPAGASAFRRLAPHEHLGRKGRSLPGSHRSHGLFVAAGPRVAPVGRVDAAIADATATLLTRMGVAPDAMASGRVLWELLVETADPSPMRTLPDASHPRSARSDESRIEARLRTLGYID